MSIRDDLKLLHIDVETVFVMSPTQRIERVNDTDSSIGPRLFLTGCPQGNSAHVRHDVEDQMAERLLAIAAEEPPWRDPWVLPQCIGKLLDVLFNNPPFATGPASRTPLNVGTGLIYQLPNHMKYEHAANIVRGDSVEGHQMRMRFAERGMPEPMVAAGFKSVADFWEPWCIAIESEEVAAIAFAARLGSTGAEIGVYTFPEFRARGFAAAVTASWSSLPSLNGRALFYSTSRSNRSSQRVAARLGLRMIGASVGIG
ncbi:MAG: GNAT family N-acetyltransferase [Candidatus Binataceae bacterium]